MNVFVSSDYHLGHANVIRYDGRPFANVDEMNEQIIKAHNEVVKPNDLFYFLGDFSFDNRKTYDFLAQLNGRKHFFKGNHDHSDTVRLYNRFGEYHGMMDEINIGIHKVVMSHYAMRVWNRSHHGSMMLYGHNHDTLEKEPWGKSMDVGIVTAGRLLGKYRPFNFYDEVLPILEKRQINEISNHRKNGIINR